MMYSVTRSDRMFKRKFMNNIPKGGLALLDTGQNQLPLFSVGLF